MATNKFIPPVFEEFSWTSGGLKANGATLPARAFDDLAQATRDITAGLGVVVGILEQDAISACNSEQPILGVQHSADLLRMAHRSLAMLNDEASRSMDSWGSYLAKKERMAGTNGTAAA